MSPASSGPSGRHSPSPKNPPAATRAAAPIGARKGAQKSATLSGGWGMVGPSSKDPLMAPRLYQDWERLEHFGVSASGNLRSRLLGTCSNCGRCDRLSLH